MHTRESRTATMVTCKVGGTELNIGKLGNFENLQIAMKVVGSIGSHIGSSMWQPS